MADADAGAGAGADRSLHRLVEEGALAARRPPIEHLRRRVGRRRARRKLGGAAMAVALLAVPTAWYAGWGARPGSPTSGVTAPAATVATGTRSAPPSFGPAQQKALVAQQAGTLTVAPASVMAGGSVSVSGHGCVSGGAVDLGFGPTAGAGVVVTVHAGPSGSFEGTVAIPPATSTGVQRLWARCRPSAGSGLTAQHGAVYVLTS